ncbi:unnamed protein product [Spodoptera littoralis]|uniref:SAM domain-containing protein n=1 Tax=Spodoptera littoralis TaxID=7109 RepID=A0A9P0HY97_SPOLI|nr:unnamed protein product [Spodoptera littoralis]CAH1636724.1 unnamed protein product [Spodoptera littoralis]
MASRIVKKVKRGKKESNSKDHIPKIVVTPPDNRDMKVQAKRSDNVRESAEASTSQVMTNKMAGFNVNQLIAELSENSKASRTEIETIQRRLLQQANEILKVNAFANPPNIDNSQKYTNKPVYGRIPIAIPRNPNAVVNGVANQVDLKESRVNTSVAVENERRIELQEAQLVPERLRDIPGDRAGAVMNSEQGNMQRVAMMAAEAGRSAFFYETGSVAGRLPRLAASARAPLTGTVEGGPPYRMPPAPEAALPGAPAPSLPAALHTHSNKFPIEREVILSSGDKNSKVPILQEARKRGRLGAVAPDTPPKALSAWTHSENQQAGTSGDGFRQYHEQYGYMNQNQGAVPRNMQNYDSPKPPIPAKTYGKVDTPNNSQLITVTVETGKDNTRDAPKSTKSVSKTYHTLKDMISSRFKSKDANDGEKNNEQEPSLNNSEERKRPERPEPEQVTPRENGPRKVEQGIYGRPMTQTRPEMQYSHGIANNMAYPSPSPHRQLMQQQQMVQSHMMMSPQARSQEMLASTPHRQPQALGADALYQQYGPPGRRSALYQRDMEVRSMANFTSLKTGPQSQFDNSHSRPDLRSPQQLEREIVRRGFVEGRRAASHPHLLDEPQHRPEVTTPQIHDPGRRNSHGNLLDHSPNEHPRNGEERESDDGGFRARLAAQGRSSYEERIRTSGRSIESQRMQDNVYRRTPDSHKERRTPDSHKERRTPDIHKERRTPDSIGHKKDEPSTSQERNDESASQKSADSVYNSSGKAEAYNPQPSSSRQTPNRIEDLKAHGKKGAGSGASSDYDKNGGQSSNVDSGRGSVAYSSGRRPEPLHDTSADSDAQGTRQPQPGTSQQPPGQSNENDWVECELRHILEPKLAGMRLDSSATSDTSVTPPLPPLSPSSDMHKRNSLPGRSSEYPEERRRGRESPRWHSHKKHSSKRDHHYKKHLFGLDTTDMTSTTTRSLDLSSLLEGRSDSSSSGDARAIRRQLRGLENMYAEVLQLLGVRKPASLAKQPTWESRLSSKRRYGSMSSLPSSSVSSRPVRDKRRSSNEHRKKHDLKGINKRFQRLESHVVTLARSVAHLSSEMRTQHLVMQEMDNIRAEIAALRHMYKSQQYIRSGSHGRHLDPYSFSNPDRVKRLTKFFGDEPPLMRLFLKKLGYEKYAALLEKEKVGAAELPYVGEDKLRALGVPLGPRMRILKEAGIHQDLHHMPRDDQHNTTTTLAIV